MTYKLILGDRIHSSWSMRGWLLAKLANTEIETQYLRFEDAPVREQLKAYGPQCTVPLLLTPEGVAVDDSIAIAEELADRFPANSIWPQDPAARAIARKLVATMHSGFTTLRNECPMDLTRAYTDVPVSDALQAELSQLETLWSYARNATQSPNGWLCGDYSAADAFYAPVAARIAGFNLPVSEETRQYVQLHLEDTNFRQWRAIGMATDTPLDRYSQTHPRQAWPMPMNLPPARKISLGTPENEACPYSGKPATWLMEIDGRVFGMCNRVCRDKTVADPEAWPAFMDLYHS
ncbi:glutathione S-transferase [Halocynthiibacter namhaensis]|uniref:glutathione S-transferase n=1 Tax=Halocynthiibacter namhaensis TaxID=1290553 RepID=UPI00057970C6|nr:glutathione S-transferase [Halocynthiibacter namhaensis]